MKKKEVRKARILRGKLEDGFSAKLSFYEADKKGRMVCLVIPDTMLAAVKKRAKKLKIPHNRYVRLVIERSLFEKMK